jgi:hypothetical protein
MLANALRYWVEALRLDANETAMFTRQLEIIESEVFNVEYVPSRAREFIPIDSSVAPGADTITYRQYDQRGVAKLIANYATDLPRVDVLGKEFTTTIQSLGDAFGYTIQDMRRAAFSGVPIDRERMAAARDAIERKVDELLAIGDTTAGLNGFLKHPNVPLIAPITGVWAGATAQQIYDDLVKLVQSVVTNTKTTHQVDTVIFDTASWGIVAHKLMGANLDRTVLKVFLENHPNIKKVDQWTRNDTANAANTGPRIVAYERNRRVVEGKMAVDFEMLPPQAKGLEFEVPCHARTGGVVVRYPMAMAYMDGV